jgi:hypothetical protein
MSTHGPIGASEPLLGPTTNGTAESTARRYRSTPVGLAALLDSSS